ncbi:MAG: ABC transporter ATP-binding protein [Spirochaetes bacterium]|nr:ABC transporter ATP-binding protein [Spirochaetota bacterium]
MHKKQPSQMRQIVRNHPFGIGLSVILSIIGSASLLPLAMFVNQVFDVHIPEGSVTNLYITLGIITGLLLLNAAMQLLNKRLTLNIIKKSIAHLRKTLIRSILSYSRMHLSQKDRDLLQSQVVQDTLRVDYLFTSFLTQFIPGVLITLGMAVGLGSINIILFVVFFALTPVIGLLSTRLSREFRKEVRAYHKIFSGFSKGVSFILRFNELIHTSSAEHQEIAHQDTAVDALQTSHKRVAWLSTLLGVIQRQTLMISGVVVLLLGGLFVISGTNTIGELISFYVAVGLVNSYARSALGAIPSMLEGRESMKRLVSILNGSDPMDGAGEDLRVSETQKTSKASAGIIINEITSIEFRQVTFGYGSSERPVLENLSFSCSMGDFFLIQGPSGIGKSTLIYLLMGFYQPLTGEIYINGKPLKDLDINSVRRLMGFVGQEPMLFPGSILENLTYGLDSAFENRAASSGAVDRELVEQACKKALIHDFIMDLPDQYDSFIGEQGMLISGGQRQRLAIARALLRNPHILILDEPENNLPQGMLDQILDKVDLTHMITLLITHRVDSAVGQGSRRCQALVFPLSIH